MAVASRPAPRWQRVTVRYIITDGRTRAGAQAVHGLRSEEGWSASKAEADVWWCWTEDHRDWFVVAGRGPAPWASSSHEGYAENKRQARASGSAEEYQARSSGLASLTAVACGAKVIREETPRVVELPGQRYVEGCWSPDLE
jgi:hypothetical protein